MQFSDALELGRPRRTKDGYLAVRARSARTGVYQYSGRELDPDNEHGLRDQAIVNVLRDENTVFDERAVRSFLGKPITVDHPTEPVTAANWKDHSRGAIMGALRDGDYLAFDPGEAGAHHRRQPHRPRQGRSRRLRMPHF